MTKDEIATAKAAVDLLKWFCGRGDMEAVQFGSGSRKKTVYLYKEDKPVVRTTQQVVDAIEVKLDAILEKI